MNRPELARALAIVVLKLLCKQNAEALKDAISERSLTPFGKRQLFSSLKIVVKIFSMFTAKFFIKDT